MRNVIVTTFITLDGVMEAPDQWSFQYMTPEIGKFKFDELYAVDTQLLGRVTYEDFARAWPDRNDEWGFAKRMNSTAKYVVSTTLKKAGWNNSHIVKDDVPEAVRRLKEESGQDILVAGSATLVRFLMAHDLVDEYRLLTYPIVRGHGKRLFDEKSTAQLKLIESRSFDSGAVLLRYVPVRG